MSHEYRYVYIRSEPGLYTVGFYVPNRKDPDNPRFEPESDHSTTEAAAERVAYLNGGGSKSDQNAKSLKYIMFECREQGVEQSVLIPIIFPEKLIHSDVAESIQHMLRFNGYVAAKAVSAGRYHQGSQKVSGDSETLKLTSKSSDAAIIRKG